MYGCICRSTRYNLCLYDQIVRVSLIQFIKKELHRYGCKFMYSLLYIYTPPSVHRCCQFIYSLLYIYTPPSVHRCCQFIYSLLYIYTPPSVHRCCKFIYSLLYIYTPPSVHRCCKFIYSLLYIYTPPSVHRCCKFMYSLLYIYTPPSVHRCCKFIYSLLYIYTPPSVHRCCTFIYSLLYIYTPPSVHRCCKFIYSLLYIYTPPSVHSRFIMHAMLVIHRISRLVCPFVLRTFLFEPESLPILVRPSWWVIAWTSLRIPWVGLAKMPPHFPSAPWLGNQRPWYMSSRVWATGHNIIKGHVLLFEKGIVSRWSVSSYSFIHQVIIITRLNKLWLCALGVTLLLETQPQKTNPAA